MRAQHVEGHSSEYGNYRETDLIVGLRELAPPDRDVHGVPPAELMPPLEGVRPPQAGPSCVHHHLPACLPLHCLHNRVQNLVSCICQALGFKHVAKCYDSDDSLLWTLCITAAMYWALSLTLFLPLPLTCHLRVHQLLHVRSHQLWLRQHIPLFQPPGVIQRYLDSRRHCLTLASAPITVHESSDRWLIGATN